MLATAKHFAGDGLTTYGTGSNSRRPATTRSTRASTRSTTRTFDRLALAPYVPAVQQHHVGSVMPSYSDVDWTEDGLGNPINMHANRDLITGWLKDQQGFDGLRDLRLQRHRPHRPRRLATFAQQVAAGVNAGIDMFMQPSNFEQFETTLTGAGQRRHGPDGRIDDAVRRILTKKFELGLFEHPFTDRTHIGQVGSPAHRARRPPGRRPSRRCC